MQSNRTFQHVEQPREPLRITLSIIADVSASGAAGFAVCARADGAVEARLPDALATLPEAAAKAKRIRDELTARGYDVAFQCDFDALVAA